MPKIGMVQNFSENIGLAVICLALGALGWQFKDHIIAWASHSIQLIQGMVPMPTRTGGEEAG